MRKLLYLGILCLSFAAHAQTCGPPLYASPCSISDTAIHGYPLPIPNWGPNVCDSTSMYTLELCGNLTGAGTIVTTNDDFHAIITRCTDANTHVIPGVVNYMTQWQTADEPSVNLWNSDDTAMMLRVVNGNQFVFLWDGVACHMLYTAPGGDIVGNHNISFPGGTVWSPSLNNHIYSLDNSTGPGIYLQDVTVTLTQSAGSTSTSNLFNFSNSQCLMNTVNGYPNDPVRIESVLSWSGTGSHVTFQVGANANHYVANQTVLLTTFTGPGSVFNGTTVTVTSTTNSQFTIASTVTGASSTGIGTGTSFPLGKWTGALSTTDGITFAVPLSASGGQGTGPYYAAWTVGQTGCDLWNTATGLITHNGVSVGTVADTQWTGAVPPCPIGGCGGKSNRFNVHNGNMGNTTTVLMASGTSGFVFGSYNDGPYFWQIGTANVLSCGISAPDWKAGLVRKDGDRILPIPVGTNAGGFMYQMIDGLGGTSGSTEPTVWNQTPGSDTVETNGSGGPTGTGPRWRNVGIGSSTTPNKTYACDGHNWKGFVGTAVGKAYTYHLYTDPFQPQVGGGPFKLGPTDATGNQIVSAGDQHFGNTNANTTDTNWIFVTSSDIITNTDLLHGTFPGALYMENFFVAPPYRSPGVINCIYNAITCPTGTLGQVRRVSHCYGSRWNPAFDVQNCMGVVSQTGKHIMFPSDFMGTNGNIKVDGSGNPQGKCNVGGLGWSANDAGDFVVGSLMMPNPQLGGSQGTNMGAYIYKAKSCAGNTTPGAACLTGPTKQSAWIQPAIAGTAGTAQGSSDGNIVWVTAPDVNVPADSAIQNCRADVGIVQLFRGSGPSPISPAPATIMFTKNGEEAPKEIRGNK